MATKLELTDDQLENARILLLWGSTLKEVAEWLQVSTITLKKYVKVPQPMTVESKLQALKDAGIAVKPRSKDLVFKVRDKEPDWYSKD